MRAKTHHLAAGRAGVDGEMRVLRSISQIHSATPHRRPQHAGRGPLCSQSINNAAAPDGLTLACQAHAS